MGPVARIHTAAPSARRVWASTVHPPARRLSFNRIAPASTSPCATTTIPIAARSQRRISAWTQIPLLSRGSMWRSGALLEPRQALDAGDVAVAIDRHEIALVEQHISAGALTAGQFGDRIVRQYQEARQLAAQIVLTRRQPAER